MIIKRETNAVVKEHLKRSTALEFYDCLINLVKTNPLKQVNGCEAYSDVGQNITARYSDGKKGPIASQAMNLMDLSFILIGSPNFSWIN